MPSSFNELKKKRQDRFDHLKNKVDKMQNNSGRNQDDRFWYPGVDNSGNGFAIIRFLDAPQGEDDPYVRIFSHGFQGPGGWYIENSLTTLGQKDPVSAYNRRLWNSGIESDKDIGRNQKRKLSYISNIYVIKDPANPENEGKVFLYRYGKRIFDKIKDKMEPEFEDETPQNIFDFWEGSNFRLKIRQVSGYRNYDKSEFDNPAPLFDDDAEIEKVWAQEHSLQEFISPDNFKTYSELKARLDNIMGFDTADAELHRPGDVVQNDPKSHETAQQKLQKEVIEGNDSNENEGVPPGWDSSQLDESSDDTSDNSDSDNDDEDYFADLANRL